MNLPELAIKRHVTTLMVLISLVVLGAVALVRLPLAFLPEIEEPRSSWSCPGTARRQSRSNAWSCVRSRTRWAA